MDPITYTPLFVGSFGFKNNSNGFRFRCHTGGHGKGRRLAHKVEQCACEDLATIRYGHGRVMIAWQDYQLIHGHKSPSVWDVKPPYTDELEPFY